MLINEINNFRDIWDKINNEFHEFTTSLHKDKKLNSVVKKFDHYKFVRLSFENLERTNVVKLLLIFPFVLNDFNLSDIKNILSYLTLNKKYEGVISLIIFLGKYLEIDSLDLYLKMDFLNNEIVDIISENRNNIFPLLFKSQIDIDFIEQSDLDISSFKKLKNKLIEEGVIQLQQ